MREHKEKMKITVEMLKKDNIKDEDIELLL